MLCVYLRNSFTSRFHPADFYWSVKNNWDKREQRRAELFHCQQWTPTSLHLLNAGACLNQPKVFMLVKVTMTRYRWHSYLYFWLKCQLHPGQLIHLFLYKTRELFFMEEWHSWSHFPEKKKKILIFGKLKLYIFLILKGRVSDFFGRFLSQLVNTFSTSIFWVQNTPVFIHSLVFVNWEQTEWGQSVPQTITNIVPGNHKQSKDSFLCWRKVRNGTEGALKGQLSRS